HDLAAWVARLEALEKRLAAGGGGSALAPTPAVSVSAPTSTLAPKASVPASAKTAEAISWSALVELVAQSKVSLAAAMEKGRGEPKAGGGYVIRFSKPFDLDSAKRSTAVIEEALARLAGRPVALELSLGASASPEPTVIVDSGAPEPSTDAAAPPGMHWKDIEAGPDGRPAGLKNAENVFGGKARIVKKPGA
ncbi:MAG: hypothetical protein HYZ74_05750, partial [Elusimicrobia bacterium]|nr:hypothetical protein [Elusimicrobiota bacterium]